MFLHGNQHLPYQEKKLCYDVVEWLHGVLLRCTHCHHGYTYSILSSSRQQRERTQAKCCLPIPYSVILSTWRGNCVTVSWNGCTTSRPSRRACTPCSPRRGRTASHPPSPWGLFKTVASTHAPQMLHALPTPSHVFARFCRRCLCRRKWATHFTHGARGTPENPIFESALFLTSKDIRPTFGWLLIKFRPVMISIQIPWYWYKVSV